MTERALLRYIYCQILHTVKLGTWQQDRLIDLLLSSFHTHNGFTLMKANAIEHRDSNTHESFESQGCAINQCLAPTRIEVAELRGCESYVPSNGHLNHQVSGFLVAITATSDHKMAVRLTDNRRKANTIQPPPPPHHTHPGQNRQTTSVCLLPNICWSQELPLQLVLAELTKGYTILKIVPDNHRSHSPIRLSEQSRLETQGCRGQYDCSQPKQRSKQRRRRSQRRTRSEELLPVIDPFPTTREVGVSRWETSCPALSYKTRRGDRTPSAHLKARRPAGTTSGSSALLTQPPKFPSRCCAVTPPALALVAVMLLQNSSSSPPCEPLYGNVVHFSASETFERSLQPLSQVRSPLDFRMASNISIGNV